MRSLRTGYTSGVRACVPPGLVTVVVMALAVIGVFAMSTGCGDDSSSETGSADAGSPTVLTYDLNSLIYSALDPSEESWYNVYHYHIYQALTTVDPSQPELVKPLLAKSWESAEDGKVWTFHLQEGVKFHGGGELTSADVKFSYERTIGIGAGAANHLFKQFESIDTPDPYTVVFRFKRPQPFPAIAAANMNQFIFSKEAFEKEGEKCFAPGNETAGTGPYIPLSATTNEVLLERNSDYWGGWEGVHAKAPDKVVIRFVTEPAVMVQQLTSGDADMATGIPVTSVEDIKNNPDLKFMSNPVWWMRDWIYLNVQGGPKGYMKDVHLREALSRAFPYEQALEVAYGGMGTLASGWVYQGQPGSEEQTAALGLPKQDLAKAKEALQQSAYPNGGITLVARVDTGLDATMQAGQLFKAALKELDINLDVRFGTTDVNWGDALAGKLDCYFSTGGENYPGAANWLQCFMWSKSPYNLSLYDNPQVDKLVDDAVSSQATDMEKSFALCTEASEIYMADYPCIFMGDLNYRLGMAKNITYEGHDDTNPFMVDFYNVQVN